MGFRNQPPIAMTPSTGLQRIAYPAAGLLLALVSLYLVTIVYAAG